jgi:NAD(P)-dependent dehydrogenase (short-subunit alcohol dehydrogenase family)
VADAFLRLGDRVVLAGRRADALDETVRLAQATTDHALCVPTDITVPEQVEALFDAAVARFGRLDVVFNNAGIGAPAVDVDELALDHWKAVVDTNLNGVFYCIRNAFRIMKKQAPMGGRIINNGSISAYAPRPNSSPYTSTKHAVLGLTKSASLDGRKYDIAVGQIDIGNALTPLAARMAIGVPQADGRIMAEAVMDVQEVARAVVHMASLPLSANVLNMTVMATKMPFVGRG